MLPDRVSNPGPLTYESGALPIALRGLAMWLKRSFGYSMSAIGLKSFIFQGSKQEIMIVVSLCKYGG